MALTSVVSGHEAFRWATLRPATARLLCGPQPTNLHWAEVARKHSNLLPHIGFSLHARHQKRLHSGHFLCRPWWTDGRLLDFSFRVRHMLAHHRIILFAFHLFGVVTLVFGGRIEMAGAGTRVQFDFFLHGGLPQTRSPRARISFRILSIPTLSMIRRPCELIRRLTQRCSLSTHKRR